MQKKFSVVIMTTNIMTEIFHLMVKHIPSYLYEILYGTQWIVLSFTCGMTVGHISNSVAMLNYPPNDKHSLHDSNSQLNASFL